MKPNRSEYLIGKLLSNELSIDELNEFLEGLGSHEMTEEYSSIFEHYFNQLLAQNPNTKDNAS
ncbi:hypothetical protein P1X15_19505 [Runella sp. MFBS21]|uniref:hypothetical protein n=1 Tax=Runella sp. MFBS21 TaxID=3034018 RepID=UPI0023F98442|nr:hypothetical protein [Runella sp. MFBS21]MDF7819817.1 hypothetical protein [Runella sp. MFBS21]